MTQTSTKTDEQAVRTSNKWKRFIVGKGFTVLARNKKDNKLKRYVKLSDMIIDEDDWDIMSVINKKVDAPLSQIKVAEITTDEASKLVPHQRIPFYTYSVNGDVLPESKVSVLYSNDDRLVYGGSSVFDADIKTHKTIHELAEGRKSFTLNIITVNNSLDIKTSSVTFHNVDKHKTVSAKGVRFYKSCIVIGAQGVVFFI